MRRLECRDDALKPAHELQSLECLGIGDSAVLSPALETAHAFAWLETLCPTLADGTELVLNCSGRGDKDVNTVAEKLGDAL